MWKSLLQDKGAFLQVLCFVLSKSVFEIFLVFPRSFVDTYYTFLIRLKNNWVADLFYQACQG